MSWVREHLFPTCAEEKIHFWTQGRKNYLAVNRGQWCIIYLACTRVLGLSLKKSYQREYALCCKVNCFPESIFLLYRTLRWWNSYHQVTECHIFFFFTSSNYWLFWAAQPVLPSCCSHLDVYMHLSFYWKTLLKVSTVSFLCWKGFGVGILFWWLQGKEMKVAFGKFWEILSVAFHELLWESCIQFGTITSIL